MKPHSTLIAFALLCCTAIAGEPPKFFADLLKQDIPVKGQMGVPVPPAEIDKYVAKVEAAARKDKEWFAEYYAKTKPGIPMPYHEKLGLTKEEYAEYIKLWGQREFKITDEVTLCMRQSSGNTWTVTATGKASTLSTLRYDPKTDTFQSPNGQLKRIEDIKAEADSIIGAWTGQEWKYEEENSLGKTKENIAFGQYNDGSYGLIVYRFQESTSAGTRLVDKGMIIRFPLPKPKTTKKP